VTEPQEQTDMAMAITLFMFLFLLVATAIVVYGVILYNSLVQVKHNVDQATANIDVLLKQRRDELPKLVDAVRSYMVYERDLLDRLTKLRTQAASAATEDERLHAEGQLTAGVQRLLAVAENYPELKANQNFMQLQSRVSALEEQIAHRREFYNEAVNINNVRMEQAPDRLLSNMAGLQRRHLFQATEQERADVSLAEGLKLPA
jgi:LemA protein